MPAAQECPCRTAKPCHGARLPRGAFEDGVPGPGPHGAASALGFGVAIGQRRTAKAGLLRPANGADHVDSPARGFASGQTSPTT